MNTNLPIYQIKDNLIDAIKNNQVVILSSKTSSGKSTQVPYILWKELGLKSIITQPRRLACVALSTYIKDNLADEEKNVVGYKTGFEEDFIKNENKILYVTDGILAAHGLMNEYDVIIIDEIHEWSLNIEVIIAYIKRMLQKHRTYKVVLMSATLDITLLQKFFWNYNPAIIYGPNPKYDIKVIEDICNNPDIINDKIIKNIAKYSDKNILCFLPGKKEIDEIYQQIQSFPGEKFILHGDQTIEEQQLAFKHTHKIILSTNVSQTSITIDDIDVVIDSGLIKQIKTVNGIKELYTTDISQSDCLQRKGRAGRTKDGIYILCSNKKVEEREEFSIPEIERVPLEDVVLRLMSMNIDIRQMDFIHRPNEDNIVTAIRLLKKLDIVTDNNIIKPIGKEITKLPLDLRCAIMLLTSRKYGKQVYNTVAKICACIQVNGLLEYNGKYSNFTKENKSDLLAEANVFEYINSHTNIDFKKLGINEKHYIKAKEYYDKINEWKIENAQSTNFKVDIQKCILTAFKDTLYTTCIKSINNYELLNNINDKLINAKIDYNSCINQDFAPFCYVGFPRIVQSKYYEEDNQIIVSKATIISPEVYSEIIGELNHQLKAKYDKDYADVYIKHFMLYGEVNNSIGIFSIIEDIYLQDVKPTLYKNIIIDIWNGSQNNQKINYFNINNLEFPIYKEKDILPYIDLDKQEVTFNTLDLDYMNSLSVCNEIKDDNEYIFLTHYDFSYYRLDELFNEVDHSQYKFTANINKQLIALPQSANFTYDDDFHLEQFFKNHKPIYIISKDITKIKHIIVKEKFNQWQLIINMQNRWISINNSKYRVECVYRKIKPDDLTLRDRQIDDNDSFYKKDNIDNFTLPDPIYYVNIRIDDLPYVKKRLYFHNKPLLLAHKKTYTYNPFSLHKLFKDAISKRLHIVNKKAKKKAEKQQEKLLQINRSMKFEDHVHPVRLRKGQYYIEIAEKSINRDCYKNIHKLFTNGTNQPILFKCRELSSFDLANLILMVNEKNKKIE